MGAVIVKNLDAGQSFDLKALYPNDYRNFTDDNFFVTAISSASGTDKITISGGNTGYFGFIGNIYKSYDSSKGILTAYNYIKGTKTGTTVKSNVRAWYISDPSQLTLIGTGTSFNIRSMFSDIYGDLTFSNFLIKSTTQFSSSHPRSTNGTYTITGSTKLVRDYTGGQLSLAYTGQDSDGTSASKSVKIYLYKPYTITVTSQNTSMGTVTGGGTYLYNKTVTITAMPKPEFEFVGWYEGDTRVSSNTTYSFTAKADHSFEARFLPTYTITLVTEGQEYGRARWSWVGSEIAVRLIATPYSKGLFEGWYVNGYLVSTLHTYEYGVTGDTTITARFVEKYDLTTSVEGEGSINVSRSLSGSNGVTVSATAAKHYSFTKFIFNEGDEDEEEAYSNPFTKVLTRDSSVKAVFTENDKYLVSSSTNIEGHDIFVSERLVYYGTDVTLFARPYPGYNFVMWEDGSTDNPRTINVTEDILVVATYWKEFDENGVYQYRCYVKDQLHLADPPIAFMRVNSFDIKRDLLTTANSTINVYKTDLTDNVKEGDILVLYDPTGKTLYQGVIESREETTIRCNQIQSFYKGEWIYETGQVPPAELDNLWVYKKYNYTEAGDCLTPADFYGRRAESTRAFSADEFSDHIENFPKEDTQEAYSKAYSAKATTYIWASRPFTISVRFETYQSGSVFLNGELLTETSWKLDGGAPRAYTVDCTFVKGMNELIICYKARNWWNGLYYDDQKYYNPNCQNGFAVYLTYQSFDPYDETKKYKEGDYCSNGAMLYVCNTDINTPEPWNASHWNESRVTAHLYNYAYLTNHPYILGFHSKKTKNTYLENALKNILYDYSEGVLVGSEYADPQVKARFGGMINHDKDHIIVGTGNNKGSITASLVTAYLGDTMDFEKFIYYLYESYGIIFDFELNFSGNNYVRIRTSPHTSLTVSDNTHAIKDITATESIEETNRLVILSSLGDYRKTFVMTKNNAVLEDPKSTANRFELTKGKIVFSDDPLEDLVAAYLPIKMYNHKLDFTLMFKNYIYEFNDFKLGMPLEIYHKEDNRHDHYTSVLTGYEMRKPEGENVTEVKFICGLVRQKLTQKLSLGRV